MTENVRQGFHHRPKSLIFPMGIFRTRKMHKIECLEPPSGPNGLKISTHTLRDNLKKFRKMQNRQKSPKNGDFRTFRGQKIAKNQNIKNLIDEFFQTISESMCTEF